MILRSISLQGGDWREAFDGLRSATPKLWQTLAPAERQIAVRKGERTGMEPIKLNFKRQFFG